MKKTFLMMVLAAGMTAFASCDSTKENQLEENAEQREDAADDADQGTAEDAAEEMSDSADTVDPQ